MRQGLGMLYELPLELIEPHCGEPRPYFKTLGKVMTSINLLASNGL